MEQISLIFGMYKVRSVPYFFSAGTSGTFYIVK